MPEPKRYWGTGRIPNEVVLVRKVICWGSWNHWILNHPLVMDIFLASLTTVHAVVWTNTIKKVMHGMHPVSTWCGQCKPVRGFSFFRWWILLNILIPHTYPPYNQRMVISSVCMVSTYRNQNISRMKPPYKMRKILILYAYHCKFGDKESDYRVWKLVISPLPEGSHRAQYTHTEILPPL